LRQLAIALVAVMLAGLGAIAPAASPTASAAPSSPKVAIIVGATHSATSKYRSYADELYAEAIKYSSNVVRVYSPNATWTAVKSAVNGASVIIYLGHGNGWPSPYTYDAKYTTKNGFGLNSTAGAGDNNTKYYGEPSIRTLTPAPNAVVLLFHLCYASGNSEPGYPDPTLSIARQRVDNYGAGFLAMGAKAVIADGHSHSPYYVSALFNTVQTIDQLWRGAPSYKGNDVAYPSSRTPGATYQMDPDSPAGGYDRSIIGDMSLSTASVTGASYADTSTDPSTFMAPGAASAEADAAPVYASLDDATAAWAAANPEVSGGEPTESPDPSTPPDPEGPAPVATLAAGTKLRVSETASLADGATLIRVTTFDGSVSGWMHGDVAKPRDSQSPRVWSVSDGSGLVTPNGDGDRDTYKLSIGLSEPTAWALVLTNSNGATVASASGTGASKASIEWDGTVNGKLVADGTYRWRLTATDAWGNAPLKASATFVLDHDPKSVLRLAGADRFATAAAISADTFAAGAPVVYIANGRNFPDALAGAAAAGSLDAPLLLVDRDVIPAPIAAELSRLKPGKIVILGGTGMVSSTTMSALGTYAGGKVLRLAGADRFATAAAISADTFAAGAPVVYIANGRNFPDALAGAAAAGSLDAPLLLVDRDVIPAPIAAELSRLKPDRIVILGGTGMVSSTTMSALAVR
jgi:putative cell wall-binding protein